MPKTWFKVDGKGDRSLELQLTGLDRLWPAIVGRSVLDVGCAEGLISLQCEQAGARLVLGVEIRRDAVAIANERAFRRRVQFIPGDANTYDPAGRYDVVLLLAILHKLRDPSAAFERYLAACTELCVVRLPHDDWPVLRDPRSGNRPHDLAIAAARAGFGLEHVAEGPVADGKPAEWVGYFARPQQP